MKSLRKNTLSKIEPAVSASGRKIGYARVSTGEQNLDLQQHALEAAGCGIIYSDKGISGATLKRPGLDKAMASLQPGDVLVVWRLDRLGRSLGHLIHMLEQFGRDGIGFTSLNDPVDTTTASGRLVLQVLGALAEFERSLISERTRAGLKAAQRRGKSLGRPKKLNPQKLDHARTLLFENGASKKTVADTLGVSTKTLYRALTKPT